MKKILFTTFIAITFAFTACKSSKPDTTDTKRTPQAMIKAGLIEDAKREFMMPSDINNQDEEDGNTVLHLAAMYNDDDLVKFLIKNGANPKLKNLEGDTPLLAAIKADATRTAATLSQEDDSLFAWDAEGITALDLGLERNPIYYDKFITPKTGEVKNPDGQTMIHYFVLTKNLEAIKHCVSNKLNLSVLDDDGRTPLDLAFDDVEDYTSVEIAAELILGGANEVETDFSYFQEAIVSRNINSLFEDNQTPLHLASIYGHTAIAQYIINNHADTNLQDTTGATPLHEAVRYGHIEIARMLIESGANINAQDNLGKTPILLAIPKDKIEQTYRLLVAYKADLSQKDAFGDTVIHTATMIHAPTAVLELLFRNGVDINAKNKEGVTPFEIAIQHKSISMTKFFAKRNADIHTKDTHGISPLNLALQADEELFESAITKNNVLTQDSQGNTPLHVALITGASFPKVQYILSLTDDVNIRNSDGNSALYLAILAEQQQVGMMLLGKGADIFSTNKDNDSPLRIALRSGGDVQKWLITSETINQTDGSGNSCLHYAAEWQYSKAIKSLLEKGANPKAKNANGETALFNAAKTNNPEIINLIVNGGTPVNERDNLGSTALHMAVRWDATKSIKKLIELGIDINAQNSAGKSALAEAALSGKIEISKILLDNGSDVNSSDTTGCTILMDAIKGLNLDVVKLLLSYNANIAIQEINGRNAYHEAANTKNQSLITLIRKAGGNPLSRDKAGNTPFSLVMSCGDINIIKAVLGTSNQITDGDGNTPIHIVVRANGSDTLLKEVIKMGYPIDSRNSDGYTALTYAVEKENLNQTTILLENNANPFQSIDKKGNNAVYIALEKGNMKIIQAIVKYAGSMSDIRGNTILHYAAKNSSVEVIEELLESGLPYGLEKYAKNISGETPYTIAVRWKQHKNAEKLK